MARSRFRLGFDGTAADDALLGDLLGFDVDENADGTSTARLRLSTRLDGSGTWSYLDDDRLRPLTLIDIHLAPGEAAPQQAVFTGYLTRTSLSLSADSDTVVDLSASDAGILLTLEDKVLPWPDLSDSDIVEAILSGYGLAGDVTATDVVHEETGTLVVQRGTDADFLRMLARRNGYELAFPCDDDGVPFCRFGPANVAATPQDPLAIRFGDDSNLVSFQVTTDVLRPLSVAARQIDAATKETAETDISAAQLPVLGADRLSELVGARLGGLVSPATEQGLLLLLPAPSADSTELATAGQAVRDEADWMTVAHGEVNAEAYGKVLRAGRPVVVKGAGKPHSGVYYVTRVTHRVAADGGYSQLFEARRNARGVSGREAFAPGTASLGVPLP